MLELKNVSLTVGTGEEAPTLLHEISLKFPSAHFGAIVGPSGCGKSMLLKVIVGVREASEGQVFWQERDLAEQDLEPSEIGYVPQFSIAYDYLTVAENVDAALRLRVEGLKAEERRERLEGILRKVGIEEIAQRQVRWLSGGQKRRLALALELVSSPVLLLCDEVDSGLDPKTEKDIIQLLHHLSQEKSRIVLSVTHSLRHLAFYDSITVIYQGSVAYHGPPKYLLQYFSVKTPEEVFPKLAKRSGVEWHVLYVKWLERYLAEKASKAVEEEEERDDSIEENTHGSESSDVEVQAEPSPEAVVTTPPTPAQTASQITPGAWNQFRVLLERRWRIFFRDRSQVLLQLALMLGFPCLVVIFALDGLPQIRNLSMSADVNVVEQLRETNTFILQSFKIGSLVSGLVMFQMILLTLMGSNNAAREVASERQIFEKEKLAGLRPSSYLASKSVFLFFLVAAQSVWMTVFVKLVCRFPGDFLVQVTFLLLVNVAMTAICLGISSWMNSAEKASLLSMYLVGFQLPLSGAVLALPKVLGVLTRPFIAAYWSWSGVLQTMRETRFYDLVQSVSQTDLSGVAICFWALVSHVIVGLFVAYLGCTQSRWE